ncbi:MAG: ABC transporter permease [Methanophagales archaeon]|nr:ABC transporter permease [Methanophagales archaeon]
MIEEVFRELRNNKLALFGVIIIFLLIFIAIFAPFIAPHDPVDQELKKRLSSPSSEYPLGTDHLGRCILSRLIYGARISLPIAMTVIGITFAIGVTIGAISGYLGGVTDEIIMRIVDVLLTFPGLILALAIIAALGPGIFNAGIALVVVGWAGYTRIVRGSVLSVKEKEFVEGVRALGASDFYILVRHILPNVIAPVIPLAMLGIGYVILAVAGLSFLGLGAQPPMPEWGAMLNDGRAFMRSAPHLMIFPGLAIMVTVLAFNLVGDGLRDALDPRARMREKVIER